jgi:hypothetical protein
VIEGGQRQLFRQPLPRMAGKNTFLQLANIRLAASVAQHRRRPPPGHHIRSPSRHGLAGCKAETARPDSIGNGIAFVGGQAVFCRDGTDNGGNGWVVAGGYPAECREGTAWNSFCYSIEKQFI